MLGYEKAITSLMYLDYKSEVIQTLVSLIFLLQYTDSYNEGTSETDKDARKFFAEEHTKMMLGMAEDYTSMHGEEGFEYLLHATSYFGNH